MDLIQTWPILKKKIIKKKSQTSLTVTHESHSLCFSSVLTNTLFLSLSKLSSLHLSSLSLSLSLSLFCAWFLFLLLCESTGSFYHSLFSGKWLILFPSFASLVSKEKSFLWVSGFTCSLLVVYLCCLIEFIVWVCVRFWF